MKIPLGYGKCRLKIAVDGIGENHFFHHLEGSSVSSRMVANEYETVNHKKVQKVQGYHLDFDLILIAEGLGSGDQHDLVDFLDDFYNNDEDYNRIMLDLYYGGPDPGTWYEKGKLWVVSSPPKLTNIGKNNIFGQILNIKVQSEVMVPKQAMREFWSTYRDTDGDWGNTAPNSGIGYNIFPIAITG